MVFGWCASLRLKSGRQNKREKKILSRLMLVCGPSLSACFCFYTIDTLSEPLKRWQGVVREFVRAYGRPCEPVGTIGR